MLSAGDDGLTDVSQDDDTEWLDGMTDAFDGLTVTRFRRIDGGLTAKNGRKKGLSGWNIPAVAG